MPPTHTLADWLNYLATIHTTAIQLGLDRIRPLAEKIGVTQFDCPVITVGGTNGKGSTVRTLEALFTAAGYKKVISYTSPHLVYFNERLRINTQVIDDDSLVRAFTKIDDMRGSQALSFFEFTTLAILDICKQQQPDALILEVGLGGRLDAVNIVEPDVAVITHIALDHQQWLGDTLEQIAFDKAGIMRSEKPVIWGDPNPPQNVLDHAHKIGASLKIMGRDFGYRINSNDWSWHGFNEELAGLPHPQLKISNVACALAAIKALKAFIKITEQQVRTALTGLTLRGRQQWINKPFRACLDVAHNPDSAQALAEMLRQQKKSTRVLAVCAMLEDKDHTNSIRPLVPLVEEWFIADLHCIRGGRAQALVNTLNSEGAIYSTHSDVATALEVVESRYQSNDIILVYGSFHTVAEALIRWQL